MPTGLPTIFDFQGRAYMPINLKWILQRNGTKQTALCASIKQMDGSPLSLSALNLILNRAEWPKKTPAHSLKAQIEKYLLDTHVPADQVAIAWDDDEHDNGGKQHPAGVHNAQHQNKRLPDEREHLEPEMLTEDAKNQFGLARDPFREDVNEEGDVFITPEIRRVRQAMWLTANHGGILAVISQSGGGKTVLRRDFYDRLERESSPVRVIMPRTVDKRELTSAHVCEAIIAELRPEEKLKRTMEGRARQAERILVDSLNAGAKHALVIEEAHDLSDTALKQLKRFWEIEKGFKKLISIILVGQTELAMKLNARANPTVREFINRCEQINLPPLDNHLGEYLKFKFKRVATSLDTVMDKGAVDAIRARLTIVRGNKTVESDVYPLTVNNLTVKAMNFAAANGIPKVTADVVSEVGK